VVAHEQAGTIWKFFSAIHFGPAHALDCPVEDLDIESSGRLHTEGLLDMLIERLPLCERVVVSIEDGHGIPSVPERRIIDVWFRVAREATPFSAGEIGIQCGVSGIGRREYDAGKTRCDYRAYRGDRACDQPGTGQAWRPVDPVLP